MKKNAIKAVEIHLTLPSLEGLVKYADTKVRAETAQEQIMSNDDSTKPCRILWIGNGAGPYNVRSPSPYNEQIQRYGQDNIDGPAYQGQIGRNGTRLSHVKAKEDAHKRDDESIHRGRRPWSLKGWERERDHSV